MKPDVAEQLLTRVLDKITHIESNQVKTATVLDGLVEGMRVFKAELSRLETDIYENGKTQWGVIFGTVGAATTMVSIVGAIIGYAWFSDIGEVGDRVTNLREIVLEHNNAEGHPYSVIAKIVALEKQVDTRFMGLEQRLDERLLQRQREQDELRKHIDTEIGRARDRLEYLERIPGQSKGVPY